MFIIIKIGLIFIIGNYNFCNFNYICLEIIERKNKIKVQEKNAYKRIATSHYVEQKVSDFK